MKTSTAEKLKELSQSNRITFETSEDKLELIHDLSDEEIREIVELEYGQTLQNVVELFKCIVKDLVKSVLKEKDEAKV